MSERWRAKLDVGRSELSAAEGGTASGRRPMSMTVALRHRGIRVAYTLGGSTAAWMAHLFFASSFVRFTCTSSGTTWAQHLATAVCAAVAASAGWVGYSLYREGRSDTEDAGTARGANHFVGLLGMIFGAVNVLLILAEGSYVVLIHSVCRT